MKRLLPMAGLLCLLVAHTAAANPSIPAGKEIAATHPSAALQTIAGGHHNDNDRDRPRDRPRDRVVLPEPGSLVLLLSGLTAVGVLTRARARKRKSVSGKDGRGR